MKKTNSFNGFLILTFICCNLSNFNAFAQKTNIWIVRVAETNPVVPGAANVSPGLSADGQERATALLKALKHEKLQAIYIPSGTPAQQTVYPLSAKVKLLPRVYTDSVGAFVKTLNRNFQGTNVLIAAQLKDILPLISQLGAEPPFDALNDEDYDLLFSITIDNNDKKDMMVSYYGKAHHVSEIPQQYLIEKYYPSYIAPINNH
ncbi:hypothetical protein [Mucilaginibacter sp. dw_454]|uniref:hypothetical protein n=1 Tax=Mucilaginibacter sp. dw_454 TaxID=2720079 RepID=UPI001BD363A4|nr:hypothetical protein [Mucilaginibacter sp. dw_454]